MDVRRKYRGVEVLLSWEDFLGRQEGWFTIYNDYRYPLGGGRENVYFVNFRYAGPPEGRFGDFKIKGAVLYLEI